MKQGSSTYLREEAKPNIWQPRVICGDPALPYSLDPLPALCKLKTTCWASIIFLNDTMADGMVQRVKTGEVGVGTNEP